MEVFALGIAVVVAMLFMIAGSVSTGYWIYTRSNTRNSRYRALRTVMSQTDKERSLRNATLKSPGSRYLENLAQFEEWNSKSSPIYLIKDPKSPSQNIQPIAL